MKIRTMIGFFLVLMLSSCCHIQVGDMSYTRLGDQQLKITISPDGSVTLEQQSKGEPLVEAMKVISNLTEVAK